MTRLSFVVIGLLGAIVALEQISCGENECDLAADHQAECVNTVYDDSIHLPPKPLDPCSGLNLCFARCYNDANCSELNAVAGSTVSTESEALIKCVNACYSKR